MGFLHFINLIVYRYLKTFIIMAKFEIKFKDFETDYSYIKAEKNNFNFCDVITISGENDGNSFLVNLDKSTAIKFAKTLRTEINKITESEVKDV